MVNYNFEKNYFDTLYGIIGDDLKKTEPDYEIMASFYMYLLLIDSENYNFEKNYDKKKRNH